MPIRIIRARDLVRRPWKNGGGTTAEVAVHPPGADVENFAWRLSMADVAADGPFSPFPGVDRTLTLIEGRGLDLAVDGRSHRVDSTFPICSFAGDADSTARLLDGPIRDFNVMTRRHRCRQKVRIGLSGKPEGTVALLALSGPARLDLDRRSVLLDRFDTILLDEPGLRFAADRPVLIVELSLAAEPRRIRSSNAF